MSNLTGNERGRYVQEMFRRIAPRYDLMNRIMTGGQDLRWRRMVIRRAMIPPRGLVLDLGAGTGDLAMEALRQHPDCTPIAVDFTLAMMQRGKQRPEAGSLRWSAADAQQLPFPDDTFDAVISGFLLRNVGDLAACLAEQRRVLKPGGWLVALDTTQPQQNLLTPLISFHLSTVIPKLGALISGEGEAYQYLPSSTVGFLAAEQLAGRLVNAGLQQVGFQRTMFGTIAIHWGRK